MKKRKKQFVAKRKNLLLMLLALILFAYAGFVNIYPSILTFSFNKLKFQEQAEKASGLRTSVGSVDFEMKPNLTLVITLRNWSSKYVDYQDCFDADFIEIQTGALSPITKNFPIKSMNLKHVKFSNQLLMPERINKLDYLPKSFEVSAFNTKKITIGAGPVTVTDFKIKHIAPDFYKEDNRRESKYTTTQVKKFLESLHMEKRNIYIK